jgi:opacity protein-like surface antigen
MISISRRLATLILFSLVLAAGTASARDDYPKGEFYLGYAALVGLNGSAAHNLNRWFGVVGDYSYRIAEYYADEPLQTFAAGPKVSVRLNRWVTPFAHVLFGAATSRCGQFSDTAGCQSDSAFAVQFGGGLDVNVGNNFSIRALQIDKIRTHFGDQAETYSGLSFGVVYRFGGSWK